MIFSVFVLTITLLTEVYSLAVTHAQPVQLLKQIDPNSLLNYILDFGGKAKSFDRYSLNIPAKKVSLPWQSLTIRYPSTFNGNLPEDRIEVYVNGQAQPVSNKYLDPENIFIQIDLANPIYPGYLGSYRDSLRQAQTDQTLAQEKKVNLLRTLESFIPEANQQIDKAKQYLGETEQLLPDGRSGYSR